MSRWNGRRVSAAWELSGISTPQALLVVKTPVTAGYVARIKRAMVSSHDASASAQISCSIRAIDTIGTMDQAVPETWLDPGGLTQALAGDDSGLVFSSEESVVSTYVGTVSGVTVDHRLKPAPSILGCVYQAPKDGGIWIPHDTYYALYLWTTLATAIGLTAELEVEVVW